MRKVCYIWIALCLLLLLAGCDQLPTPDWTPPASTAAGPAQTGGDRESAPAGAPEGETAESAAPTPAPEPPTPSPSPAPVRFAAGEASWDSRELTLVLQEGETALLDQLPELQRLDARGSECWEELLTWSESRPEVELLYTVTLPGLGPVEGETESLDLTGLGPEEIREALPRLRFLPGLKELKLPAGEEGVDLDTALEIAAALPETVIAYPFTIYGQEADLSDTELVLFHQKVYDEGEEVRRVLPAMHACTWLDMDSCGVDNENMARIRDENPDVEVIWRVWFGENYSVRTNVTKILASMPSQGGLIKDSNSEGLYYCTKVRYLDLGHNHSLKDFSFVENMPDLEIAVISMADIDDLSPFASCKKLLYLEMGNTNVSDLSPLAECTNLRHQNIGTNIGITDISPLYELPLLRLWIGNYTPIPEEQVEKMQELHPDCDINTTVPSGLEKDENGGAANEGYTILWKSYSLPMDMGSYWIGARPIGYYKVVYKCFDYGHNVRAYAFAWNDPKYTGFDPYVEPVNVTVWDTSFLLEYWRDPHSDEPDDTDGPPGEVLYRFEH